MGQGRDRPLNSYPDALFEAISDAALSDVRAARDRLLPGELLAAAGRDPAGEGWYGWTPENAAWHIARHGPLTGAVRAEQLDASPAELPDEQVVAALSGEGDVWLASCRDFYASPFARAPGAGRPVAVWGCLECSNAVFTTRHLPSIFSFTAFLTAQREEMTVLDWNARYALAWERITTGFLPQFTGEQQATARLIAESHDPALHLPGQIFQGLT